MRYIPLLLLALWIGTDSAFAADRKFPYEAVVDVEEEFVRSGAGQKYYPTGKLKRGERVTVHRHDPGGWVMIAPPPGSFSWIEAKHVRRQQGETGVLSASNVIVRVGSVFNDDHDWYQVELSKGQTVEILGEKTLQTDRGAVAVLKIKPPANEYRWIMGRALRSVDAPVLKPLNRDDIAAKQQPTKISPLEERDSDPFTDGPAPTLIIDEQATPSKIAPVPVTETTPNIDQDQVEHDEFRARLRTIDEQFRTMIQEEPPKWDLTSVEQQYRQLDGSTDSPVLKTKLKLRLDAVQRYAKTRQEYDEFMRITSEAKQRDAQLTSLTNQPAPNAVPTPAPASTAPTPDAATPPPAAPRRFDGAGVILRAPGLVRGAPQYGLFAPGGRMLAYLQAAPGVNLNSYVGQAMGVFGQRSYRQELQSELIIVRSLQPVRLKTGS